MKAPKKFLTRLGAVAIAGAVAATVLPATPALALGNNRVVTRGCGENYVSSGYYSAGSGRYTSWAQTSKRGGSCSGRLSSALVRSNGAQTTRVYGSNSVAYAEYTEAPIARQGLHWGCDSCGATTS
ncbi:hypothetical protein C1I95_04220 [Micromonospora craterilacus]|uniref:Uncharacterized protein n=1 Tax=Micromonospora craterilacus TaxID=1655439 RepID=A0A2W2FM74_9ACTN|nr:hypothetical protein [Micromonospora craterilacus]PZG22897.1 hypothetical protein C1I95_04220 [Micromonospora craterilacus]